LNRGARTVIQLMLLMTALFIVFGAQDPVSYESLALNVSNGVTYVLYPALFSIYTFASIIALGLMFTLVKSSKLASYCMTLILYLWPMFFALSLLLRGYVVGDQPRLEFAAAFYMVSQGFPLEEVRKLSGYFNWPSFWLLSGIYSGITDLSPFEAPPTLMVSIYLVLGLYLYIATKKIWVLAIGSEERREIQTLLFYIPFILYILNPYKILHPSPQIYALTLFLLLIVLLINAATSASGIVLAIVTSLAIITSHPLTSIIVVGLWIAIAIYDVSLESGKRKPIYIEVASGLAVMISFIIWNLNYEKLIKSVLEELLQPRIQGLPPVAGTGIYSVNSFFVFMAFLRYLAVLFLALTALTTFVRMLISRRALRLVFIIAGSIGGGLALNFIPGSFLHRVLYFSFTLAIPLSASTIGMVLQNKQAKTLISKSMALLFIPLLTHLYLIEFLTNNNPVAAITGTYEMHTNSFIVEYLDPAYIRSVGVPSGAIDFYIVLNRAFNWSLDRTLTAGRSMYAPIPSTSNSVIMFIKTVYSGDLFVVSPRELYVVFHRTGFHDFNLLNMYLNNMFNKLYDNELFKVFIKSTAI